MKTDFQDGYLLQTILNKGTATGVPPCPHTFVCVGLFHNDNAIESPNRPEIHFIWDHLG